jgi:nicotinate-nucleotide pyrophosphorylase (carboxylating)
MWALELADIDAVVDRALGEDLPGADVTAVTTVPAGTAAHGRVVVRADVVVCGQAVAQRVFARVDTALVWEEVVADGARASKGSEIAIVSGPARSLLAAERTALNFMQRLTGTATTTRAFVDAAGGRCRIADTRKTTPGLRALQRWAVRCGGGHNHRNDLTGGVLIKENHIRAAGGIVRAIAGAKAGAPHSLRIECEVTTLDELALALEAGADAVLLDNMDDAQVGEAVRRVAGRVPVEVSGNVDLERVPRLAALGVDVVSVGALTHSARAADIALKFDIVP